MGLFLGDYQALTSMGNTLLPFYVTTNAASPANLTDVFATLVTVSTPIPTAMGRAAPGMGAPLLELAPEFRQRLSDAAQRTLQRRQVGPTSAKIAPAPAIDLRQ